MTTHTDAVLGLIVDHQLPGAELPEIPRRFAIFTYDADDEPELYMWGIQTERRAVGFHHTGGSTHRAATADDIHSLVDRVMDASLVWLDPTSADLTPTPPAPPTDLSLSDLLQPAPADADPDPADPDPAPADTAPAPTGTDQDQAPLGTGDDRAPVGAAETGSCPT